MEGGALHDALEAVGRLGLLLAVDDEVFEFGVQIMDDRLAQGVEIDAAGAHHRRGVDIVDQREQQMFKGRIFVMALVREREGLSERFLKRAGENRHGTSHFFSMMH